MLSRTIQICNILNKPAPAKLTAMKLPVSTEWVLHCTTTLALLDIGTTASAAQLAQYFDVPAPYLAKQL
jgi:hypothetical protein